jgi:hypothetical protein
MLELSLRARVLAVLTSEFRLFFVSDTLSDVTTVSVSVFHPELVPRFPGPRPALCLSFPGC